MPKQAYNWGKVTAGDIISFRYKGKQKTATLTTVLVLNTKMPVTLKDGTKNFHLIGLKLEEQGTVPLIRNKPLLVSLLETIGNISVVDGKNGIFRVDITGTGPRGVTKRTYNSIKKKLQQFTVYRTYNFEEARKSSVFLEPIDLPKQLVEVLLEN
tara:strand:+ start:905 stop:1369 length:465 start_codon:yes stop_codon:yes gene_type:complete